MATSGLCPCCGTVGPLICIKCANSVLSEKKKLLSQLVEARAKIIRKFEAQLDNKKIFDKYILKHLDVTVGYAETKRNLMAARKALEKEQGESRLKRVNIDAERRQLDISSQQLLKGKSDDLYLPSIHLNSLAVKEKIKELNKFRRRKIILLCQHFPMRMPVVDVPEGWDGSQKLTQSVRIRGARLPHASDPLSVPKKELSASLGYLLQFVSLLALYSSVPLLHCSDFALSTSHIWQRSSYSNRRPSNSSEKYPLFLPRTAAMDSNDPELVGSSEGSENEQVLKRVRKGILTLQCSVACICDELGSVLGIQEPPSADMSPFERLAMLMSGITRDTDWGSSIGASNLKEGFAGESLNGTPVSLFAPPAWKTDNSAMDELPLLKESAGRPVAFLSDISSLPEEDWAVLDGLPLPPPPSSEEDVEHWARAMITDAKK